MHQPMRSRQLWEARQYESHYSQFVEEEARSAFHLTPYVGWMNDPNGFSFHEGKYHLFYQYNPYAAEWGPMHWGHAVSKDMLHWEHLPAALSPEMPYESSGGCFSGSALVLPDGRHLLMYTGVSAGGFKRDGSLIDIQQQCIAIGDGLDYEKYEHNPVISADTIPEGANSEHFRDPKVWQEPDGSYRCVVAVLGADGSGQILLYSSKDALSWKAEGVLASNRGRYGVMWECPDFFELDGKHVLLVSPQDMLPEGHDFHGGNNVICLIGHMDEETGEFVEENVHTVDHGIDFYATQTMLAPDGRRVMVAWMQNWDTVLAKHPQSRIFGQMSVPRELAIRDGRLIQQPIRELEGLRGERVVHEGVSLKDGSIALEGVEGRCVDLTVNVRPKDPTKPFREFGIWVARDENVHTSFRYRPEKGEIKVNRTRSGSRRAVLHHRKCIVDGERNELSVRIIIDRHSAEFFVNGGERTISITIPTSLDAQGISFYAEGDVVLDVEKYDLDTANESAIG